MCENFVYREFSEKPHGDEKHFPREIRIVRDFLFSQTSLGSATSCLDQKNLSKIIQFSFSSLSRRVSRKKILICQFEWKFNKKKHIKKVEVKIKASQKKSFVASKI